jgi:anti-sigma regulatory factor (Ser/Thr protein kinase)
MSGAVRRVMAADGAAPAAVRQLFRAWLGELSWPMEDADDLLLAVSEAVSNSAEHAYPPGLVGHVVVEAECVLDGNGSRQVVITVDDQGSWRPPPDWHENRRRGLPLMRACTASLDVSGTPSGTRVRMVSNPVPSLH